MTLNATLEIATIPELPSCHNSMDSKMVTELSDFDFLGSVGEWSTPWLI